MKIAASKTTSGFVMSELYYRFLSKYEGVKLETNTLNSSLIIQQVLNGQIDMGVIETDCDELDIIKEKLLDDEIIIVTGDEKSEKECYIDSVKKMAFKGERFRNQRDIFQGPAETCKAD